MSGERQTERCARDSDWCDGMLCHDPPHGIGMNPGCPNADPVGLKSTCDKRPGCGCSIECKDYLARVRGERQTETHQADRPRVSDITPAWMNYADHLEAELTRVRAERDRFAKDAEDWEANAQAAEARVAELETEPHQTERVRDGMGHVWTEESDLDRLDELEAEAARVRAERDDWRYRAQDVERFKARADRAEARVAELEAERDRAVAERTEEFKAWLWLRERDDRKRLGGLVHAFEREFPVPNPGGQ